MSVNLLPPPPPVVRAKIGGRALLFAIWVLLLLGIGTQIQKAVAQQQALRDQIAVDSNTLVELDAKWTQLASIRSDYALAKAVKNAEASSSNPVPSVQSFLSNLSVGANVSNLNYASNAINAEVMFSSLHSAAASIARLQNDPLFVQPVVDSVAENSGGQVAVTFSLQLALPPGGGS